MSASMIPEETSVNEALDNAESSTLLPSDGSESSLSFRQLQAGLQEMGLNVNAAAPEGTSGEFNAKTANAETKAPAVGPQPDMTPDLVVAQQQNNTMNFNNS